MLPDEFSKIIKKIIPDEYEAFFETYKSPAIKALRVNTLKGSIEDFISNNYWNINLDNQVSWCKEGFYCEAKDIGKHPYHNAGVYYIQDASAMAPVTYLDINANDRVLDLCASPGGKSTQIAALLNNTGILVSNEINYERAKNLSENIERMGIANALVISHDPIKLPEHFSGFFNKILVDAPCSGEGMFRKNPEAINEWSIENVKLCVERQQYILNEADKMLCDGGRLVYSTCTFNDLEDEGSIKEFLNNHSNYKLILTKRLWPHKVKGEGHFVAVLEKTGCYAENAYPSKGYIKTIPYKDIKELKAFADETLNTDVTDIFNNCKTSFVKFGDKVYAVPDTFPSVDRLKVLRLGLHLGTLKKGRFEPSHSLAMYLKASDAKRCINLTYDEANAYLKGMTINKDGEKGYCLLCFDGYPLGWGKLSSGIVKNHYPKGLRNI